jgi:hypothetical protein
MSQTTYVVVPFERQGTKIGPRHALVCAVARQAKAVARQLAPQVPGVAIIERTIDPDTGDDVDRLVAEIGAIPPRFPDGVDWTLRLN